MIDEIQKMRDNDEKHLGAGRDRILQFIQDHEERIHDGGCCLEERVNAVAFIAHSLGLLAGADETWTMVRAILEVVYEAHHSGGTSP
jgi:hypothetical protein